MINKKNHSRSGGNGFLNVTSHNNKVRTDYNNDRDHKSKERMPNLPLAVFPFTNMHEHKELNRHLNESKDEDNHYSNGPL